jgi:hypothetical protein
MPRAEKTFTLTLYGLDTFEIEEEDSIILLSVTALNAVSGSMEMIEPITVGGKPSTAVPIMLGTPITVSPATENGVLSGIRIAVPAGGQLAIVCQI